jgi:hypothetical protein
MDDYTKPKLPNREVYIGGIKVQVTSDEECLQADHAIAMPAYIHQKAVAAGAPEIEGTKSGFPCKVCGQDCVLAPSGQVLNARGLQYTCMDCMVKIFDAEKHA